MKISIDETGITLRRDGDYFKLGANKVSMQKDSRVFYCQNDETDILRFSNDGDVWVVGFGDFNTVVQSMFDVYLDVEHNKICI